MKERTGIDCSKWNNNKGPLLSFILQTLTHFDGRKTLSILVTYGQLLNVHEMVSSSPNPVRKIHIRHQIL